MSVSAGQPKPTVAISMGDPLGIGPEIIVKALADESLRRRARFHIRGLATALSVAARRASITPFWHGVPHDAPDAGLATRHDVLLLDYPELDGTAGSAPAPGPTRLGGLASFRFVADCIGAAQRPPTDPWHADAIVTAPISKTSWHLAGHTQFPGHTELLASRFTAPRTAMLFVGPHLRVILATIHIPLMAVRGALSAAKVLDAIELGHQACQRLGIGSPRIAVCGLNPHAGEDGLMGDDEPRLITPAINQAQARSIDARGPFPADTLFLAAATGQYDLVVAMYHDQGLIPVKLLDRHQAVNITVGLPIVRTSPAHGTAFDIAGQNRADAGSMRAALELTLRMAGPAPMLP